MSDITPADALRELGDDQAEYAAAAAKKLRLPESKPMLQAIRERWERDPSNTYPSDVGTLLAEIERLQMKGIEDCRVLHGYLNDRDIEIARRDKVLEAVRSAANGQVPGLKAFDPMQHPDVALRDVLHALDPQCSCGAHPHADYCPLTEESP